MTRRVNNATVKRNLSNAVCLATVSTSQTNHGRDSWKLIICATARWRAERAWSLCNHCNHARLMPDVHQTKRVAVKTINRRRLSRLHLGRLVPSAKVTAKGKRRLAARHRHAHTPQRNRSHLVPLRSPAHSRSRSFKTLSACVSVAAARHALCHARTVPTMSRRVNIAIAARSIRAVSGVLAAWHPHAKNACTCSVRKSA